MNAKVAILAIFLVSSGGPAAAQAPPAGEYEVKAASLYNFARLVEWSPESSQLPPLHSVTSRRPR